jgi:hypothetical protein
VSVGSSGGIGSWGSSSPWSSGFPGVTHIGDRGRRGEGQGTGVIDMQ